MYRIITEKAKYMETKLKSTQKSKRDKIWIRLLLVIHNQLFEGTKIAQDTDQQHCFLH